MFEMRFVQGRYAIGMAVVLAMLFGTSCSKVLSVSDEERSSRTVLVYLGGDNNLSGEVAQKREALRRGRRSFPGGEVLLYEDTGSGARLLRIAPGGILETVADYGAENSASAAVFGRVLRDVLSGYPADGYGLVFFSHGSGWLPAGSLQNPRRAASPATGSPSSLASSGSRSMGWDDGGGEDMPGGMTHAEMELDEFAAAIPDGTLDFIIFEACLMAGVEVAYALRGKAEYLLASPAEIISPGFTPVYPEALGYLLDRSQSTDLSLKAFGERYMTHVHTLEGDYRSATLSVVSTQELDLLAARTRELHLSFTGRTDIINELQHFDRPGSYGDSPAVARYFDLGQWAEAADSPASYASWREQLERTIVWKACTEHFLPNQNGFAIRHYSGLTTYTEQEELPALNEYYRTTAWYRALWHGTASE